MKKLITATALAAFVLATAGSAMAEDSKANSPTQKTGTQQQMETQSTDAAKKPASATTGSSMNAPIKPGDSKVPGKPTDTIKDTGK